MNSDHNYKGLRQVSEVLEDLMKFRISTDNKLRAANTNTDTSRFDEMSTGIAAVEHLAELTLKAQLKKTVGPNVKTWYKAQSGIGDKLLGRLLGMIGNPYIAYPHHWEEKSGKKNGELVADAPFPRRVSDLWAYCGHGDPNRRPVKGMSAEDAIAMGNPKAKMIVHLLAEACVKSGIRKLDGVDDEGGYDIGGRTAISHYGEVYLHARKQYEGSLHPVECKRCGPSGKPALEGSVRSAGHQHAMALRKVGKEILKDLWVAAKVDHEAN